MQILIRSAKIIDPSSSYHLQSMDILIEDGVIKEIGKDLDGNGADEVIEGDDLHVSNGWVDMYATFGDPGKEFKEDIETGLNAAAHGGFTKVAVSPESNPVADNKSAIRYMLKKAEDNAVDLIPIGASTKGLKGESMAEMYDMQLSGAKAFSNGKHAVSNTKVQDLIFRYGGNLNAAIYTFCQDSKIADGGQMHEGVVNTSLGLKGIPPLAEEVMVARDLFLAEYSTVPVHFSHITTKGSVHLIRQAKQKGLQVTASVPAHHLAIADDSISDFDSNFKVSPPFRDSEHITALIAGVADGTIDAIISDHEPQEIEAKFSEFSTAEPGIIALETAFSVALEALSSTMSIEDIIARFTIGPRKILGLPQSLIEAGQNAELTIFAPFISWTYTEDEIKSLSKNSPVLNKELTGLPVAIVNNGKLYLNS